MVYGEKQEQLPAAGILGRLPRFSYGVRLAARILRSGTPDDNMLELVDVLGDLIFEDLEVFLAKIGDRHAVARRVDVDPHVTGVSAEGRLSRGLILRAQRRETNRRREQRDCAHRPRRHATCAPWHSRIM